eukprot:25556_1
MTPDWALIGVITSWVVYPLSIAFLIFVIYKDYNKRKDASYVIVNQKWLQIWSMCTMISCTLLITFYLFHKIPYICLYTYRLETPLFTLSGVLLTYYQISRLEYCFSVGNIHSNTYGINKCTFITLYVIGMLLPIFTIITTTYGQRVVSVGILGCHWKHNPQYIFQFTLPTILAYYIFYDLLVLGIYIYKIHQIRKHTAFKDEVIYKRINFILHKIQLLTIVYEINAIILFVVACMTAFSPFGLAVVLPITNCIHTIWSVITIYLMVEHNNSEYMRLINTFNNKKLYCCCRKIIVDSIQYQKEIEMQVQKKEINLSNIDTRDITLKMEHEIYQSKMSQLY